MERKDLGKLLYFFLSFTGVLNIATGWNLNAHNGKLFNEPKLSESVRASYFGFSAALYTSGDSADASAILVGAPRSNVSALGPVLEPGTVYLCRIHDEKCVLWNLHATDESIINGMNNSWTGAVIEIERNREPPKVVVCAPRWKETTLTNSTQLHGMCYSSIVEDLTTFERRARTKWFPLRTNKQDQVRKRMYHYAMGEVGASLHLYSDRYNSEMILGSPGIDNWRGAPILIKEPYSVIIPEIGIRTGVVHNDYFGYSVSSGCYHRKGVRKYAGGAPRGGDDLTGQVVIYNFPVYSGNPLEGETQLYGEQLGEYFGASLASCNVDDNELDEIIVGAPMWSNNMDEQGRVYVYYYNRRNRKHEPVYLEGTANGGRFGSVVTCLGDLDRDDYDDIAVGAPYEGDHGAIYIYNGNRGGLSTKYSQRIFGKDINEAVRGFGASISEPRDVDGNAYVDLAVGAYLSGHVILLRSQPVVKIQVSVTGPYDKKLPANAERFSITVCSFYDGYRAPRKLAVKKILRLDPLKTFYGDVNDKTGLYEIPVTLDRGFYTCSAIEINLVKDILNALEPIVVGVSLDLAQPPSLDFCADCPLVNKQRSTVNDSLTLYYQLNCGANSICNSIFEITSLTISGDDVNGDRYTLGSNPNARLTVQVANSGEPAYNAQLHVFVPSPISLSRMPPNCWDIRHGETLEVTCSFGTLVQKQDRDDKTTLREIHLDMSKVQSDSPQLSLFANVTTGSRNIDSPFTSGNLTIYFDTDVDMAIAGKSPQGPYSYTNKDQVQQMESIRFQHIYEVQKFGRSPIEESVISVSVPTHLFNDDKSVVEIASVNETVGVMEGQSLDCGVSSNTMAEYSDTYRPDVPAESLILESAADIVEKNSTNERVNVTSGNSKLAVPPANRTFYLNCTNEAVQCTQISCKLGRFADSLAVAKVTVTLDLQLQNFPSGVFESRDVIFFVSNGSVSGSVQPPRSTERVDDKPDTTLVGTIFVGSPIASRVAVWVIVLSVLLGILLLVLLTLGLVKLGFFHRNKKEQLEALMAASDKNHGFVLETSSSREALDND